jgi:hypothetical protein
MMQLIDDDKKQHSNWPWVAGVFDMTECSIVVSNSRFANDFLLILFFYYCRHCLL